EPRTVTRAGSFRREISTDLIEGTSRTHMHLDYGEERVEPSGMVIGRINDETYEIGRFDPLSARIDTRWTMTMERGDWSIRTESDAQMSADATCFRIVARLDLFEGEHLAKSRTWDVTIPREGVSTPDACAGVINPEGHKA
ncbi:MAG TPA: hypothetical protein VIQ29_09525, partial [Ancylobacter sp.]